MDLLRDTLIYAAASRGTPKYLPKSSVLLKPQSLLLLLGSDTITFTTRKPEKTNGITDGIFLSVIYTDGNNSVFKSVGIYRRNKPVGIYRQNIPSVYTDGFADGVYSLSENMQRRGDVRRFYRQNYRGIQTDIAVQ
jgi:hypothetical protein